MSNTGRNGQPHDTEPKDIDLRIKALESILLDKGLVDAQGLNEIIETYENRIGPHNGAQIVARAWTKSDYKKWLLNDGTAAIASLGFTGIEGADVVVVENTPNVHNVIVCTLCSCYPWPILGLPPRWYKSAAYRARVVIEPRSVLAEFGLILEEQCEVRVWDSTAEVRYMVLPERPPGSEGLDEKPLAELVTRDSMIGVARL